MTESIVVCNFCELSYYAGDGHQCAGNFVLPARAREAMQAEIEVAELLKYAGGSDKPIPPPLSALPQLTIHDFAEASGEFSYIGTQATPFIVAGLRKLADIIESRQAVIVNDGITLEHTAPVTDFVTSRLTIAYAEKRAQK